MKLRTQRVAIIATLLLGAITCLGGCATTGMERAAKTTNKVQTVEGDIQQAVVQVDTTKASLQELIKPDQVDVKKAYDAYAANVARMETIGKQLDKHTDQMNSLGKDYFAEWEKQGDKYSNPQIRELSEQRRAELSQVYAQIPQASVGVKGALRSYMTDIKEIQKYLSNDLTPKGIETITPVAQQAIKDGDNLKDAVKPVLSAMDRAKAEMAQGITEKGSAAGGRQ